MRIKVINKELSTFDKDFKVKNINYDMVVIDDNHERKALSMEDVEIIPENKYEDIIAGCKDIIKIKLNRGIPMTFYMALIQGIHDKMGRDIENIEVLRDDFKTSKTGSWEKKLVMVVNEVMPLDVTVIGTKYEKEVSITFREITLIDFINGCTEDINHLKKEIEEKEKTIKRYKKILKEALNNSIAGECSCVKKLVSGN